MPLLQEIRNFNLKVIFVVHFVFISLSLMGHWNGSAFFFYSSLLILLLIWSIYDSEREHPLQLAIVVNGFSIILDILLLCMNYPTLDDRASERFSAAMCILHLIIRPFSTILLIQALNQRVGSTGVVTNLFASSSRERSTYEDIERNQAPTGSSDYNIANAQQI